MIMLKELNGEEFVLNCDMIELIMENPDTTILLTNGKRLIVSETKEEVVDRVAAFRRRTFGELLDQIKEQYTYQTQKEEEKDVIIMHIMSILGLILAVTLIIFRMVFDQEAMQVTLSSIRAFVNCPSVVITIGGTVGVMMLSFLSKSFREIGKHLKIIFRPRKYEPRQSMDQIMELAVGACMKGLSSLEGELAEVDEPFLYNGLILVVDSADSEKARQVMKTGLEQLGEHHALDRAFYEKAAAYSPAFGTISTLVGLILILDNISDMDVLAKGMATALIIMLYGSLIANVVCLPVASKLKARHDEKFLCKQLVAEGVLAIREGENPKFIEEKLSELPPATFVKQETDTEAEKKKGLLGENRNCTK